MPSTWIIDQVGLGAGVVVLTWAAIDNTATIYTGYRAALTGVVSPPEQYVPIGQTTATFQGVVAGYYTGVAQLSVADLSQVDTQTIRTSDANITGGTTMRLL